VHCRACEFTNEPGSRFCAECGTELTITCPNCSAISPGGTKFCNTCGHDLRAPSQPPDDPIARLVPPEMLAKLQSAQAGNAMRGERRTVTMLFADVKGSTAAAEQLDPEDWADVINGAFEHLIAPIYRYEGTLARLLGDAILAFFGAPIAHEDDPIRAIRAGLEILGAMDAYGAEIRRRHGVPLEVRVGINTGLVVVGEVGSDLRVEYTALGDAINVAARMEQTARPGTIQVTEHTLSLTHDAFDAEDLGLVEVKGKSEPIRTFRPNRYVGRQTAGLAGEVVGRDREMAVLEDLHTRLATGRGWIASIIAEPGLGKSALVREWRRRVGESTSVAEGFAATGEIGWLFGACQSYDATTPFAGIRELLRPWLGLDGSDDFARIERATAEVEMADVATFVGYVVGADLPASSREFIEALAPPVLRARANGAIKAYLAAEALRRPLLLVCEDLHWADDASIDIVTDLLGLVEGSPIGLAVVMRPYRDDPSWRVHERASRDYHHRYHHLELEPMRLDASALLLHGLLEGTPIDDGARRDILARADGNPLFLEEIANTVRLGGGVAGVPTSLSGVLTARLDRLDERSRLVAQVASVLGTEFKRADLAPLIEGSDVESALADLLRSGVLVESPVTADGLRFRHALAHEAAYETVLLKTRRRLHHSVADHLVASRPDEVEEIARHLVAAEDHEAAFPHLVEAGLRATKAMSLADAIRAFRQALDHEPDDADPDLVQRAHLGLGEAYALLPDLSESAAAFQRLFDYGEQHHRPNAQVAALNNLAYTTAAFGGDPASAQGYLAQARRLAEEVGDERGLADYHMNACLVASLMGDAPTSVIHDEATIDLGDQLGDDRIRVAGIARRAMNQVIALDLDGAESSIELALAATEDPAFEVLRAEVSMLGLGLSSLARGDFQEGRELIEAQLSTLERYASFNTAMAHRFHGFLRYQVGDLEGALASMAAARRIAQHAGQPFVDGTAAAGLAAVYATLGRGDEIPALREQMMAMSSGPLPDLYASTAWADLGTAELMGGDSPAAEESFSRGLATSSVTQFLERTRLLAGLALSLIDQGDLERADTLLREGREFATAHAFTASDALLDHVEGELHAASGRRAEAEAAFGRSMRFAERRGQRLQLAAAARSAAGVADDPAPHLDLARRVVGELAGEIVDEDLRASFVDHWAAPVRLASA
jgi:class 3 adenylate cyclase/tetratricopeptide (TPR) repeat protein